MYGLTCNARALALVVSSLERQEYNVSYGKKWRATYGRNGWVGEKQMTLDHLPFDSPKLIGERRDGRALIGHLTASEHLNRCGRLDHLAQDGRLVLAAAHGEGLGGDAQQGVVEVVEGHGGGDSFARTPVRTPSLLVVSHTHTENWTLSRAVVQAGRSRNSDQVFSMVIISESDLWNCSTYSLAPGWSRFCGGGGHDLLE